jgi:L-ascorbate metabolism protein UlaG (beta-lactamase superfamily)
MIDSHDAAGAALTGKFPMRGAFAIIVLLLLPAVFGSGCGWLSPKPALSEEAMKRAKNYQNGVFVNSEPTTVMRPGTNWKTFYEFLFRGSSERVPNKPLPVVPAKAFVQGPASASPRFIWLGHSSVLLELGGKRVLIDPVLSERASFFSWMGPKRFEPAPLEAKDFPALDAVLISHDHYDHLDKATIKALADKTASFHVPLCVGAILKDWGIPENKIIEYAWWDEHATGGMTVVAVPARHFSGRGLFDRNNTLWCSWVVIAGRGRVYHSGDTGMTAQFKEIGEKYGPFDLAFIKIAAFNENWPDIHLTPEQTVEAAKILGGKTLCPIHWGTFDLGLHSWHEPIERFVKAAEQEKQRIVTPKIGELVDPENYENVFWWKDLTDSGKKPE